MEKKRCHIRSFLDEVTRTYLQAYTIFHVLAKSEFNAEYKYECDAYFTDMQKGTCVKVVSYSLSYSASDSDFSQTTSQGQD